MIPTLKSSQVEYYKTGQLGASVRNECGFFGRPMLRHLLLSLCLPGFVGAADLTAPSAVLPEVNDHLRQAQTCLDKGDRVMAAAHANLILVSSQIRVKARFEGVPPAMQARCRSALDSAFTLWETALGDSFSFVPVEDPMAEADVYVVFHPEVRQSGQPVAGYVRWQRTLEGDRNRGLTHTYRADMMLRTTTLKKRPMPFEVIRHEACHELGHVLGLDDTNIVGAVMGPLDLNRPASGPSDAEVEAVRLVRTEATRLLESTKTL